MVKISILGLLMIALAAFRQAPIVLMPDEILVTPMTEPGREIKRETCVSEDSRCRIGMQKEI